MVPSSLIVANTDVPDTVFNVKSDETSSTPVSSASCASSSSNTGAIAGGTVGGFAGGAVLGALAAFLAGRKKTAKKTDDGQHSVHSQDTQDTIMAEKARIASIA